ncbi:hypothetical protein, variant [Aphanomyces astaci]|uniref:Uncharacterized protein n=1 Tax=Aphanomyces astaci TaxID=112090 RepID=W4HBA7_APHAT|nr:hypothetical protein, variant [Aphanomyces astaci]ETV89217.1 hypothetical protein, variant [Aphanomyces astaci]|eukprot:XP_009821617.1 hypothetical protein, variant [Aphanomyces astaci]
MGSSVVAIAAVLVLFATANIEAKTAKEICASPTCNRADMGCFGYGANGACPFANMVDCSKQPPPPTTVASTTSVSPSSTHAPTTATTPTTSPKPTDAESSGSNYPYIIAGGAVALIAIGALVFILIRKSGGRNNQEDDDIEVANYAKAVPVQGKDDPSAYGYPEQENKSFGEVPMHQRHNKSFGNQDLRRQNTGSFVTPAQPIARPNTTSFLQNNQGLVVVPHVETKEQFYVPESTQDYHHPGAPAAPEPNRRESFEF